MKRAVNYLRGTATLTARGLFPERLLNLCAQEGVACWALEWTDSHTMRLTTHRRRPASARRLAQRVGCVRWRWRGPGDCRTFCPGSGGGMPSSSGWPSPCWR
ncbi:MAG: sporulation protein YqfD [Lawsonibacter sp.]